PDLVEELVAALEIPVLSGGDHISVALAIVGGGVASSWTRRRSAARERGPGAIDGERGSGHTQNDDNQGRGQREMLATSGHRATSMAQSWSSVRGRGPRTSAQTYREKLARSGRPRYVLGGFIKRIRRCVLADFASRPRPSTHLEDQL